MAATHVQTVTNSGGASTASVVFPPGSEPANLSLLVASVGTKNAEAFSGVGAGWSAGPKGSQLATFYKIAGASESATQSPATGLTNDWLCAVTEYTVSTAYATLNVSGATNDATSPQDQAALNPTDSVDAILYAAAFSEANRTYSAQTIGGVAANERADFQYGGGNTLTLTVFDRLNVNTGSSTFAAQATPSGVPTNGAIALLIFSLAPVSNDATVGPVVLAATAAFTAAVMIGYPIPITVLTVPAQPILVVE